MLEQSHKLNSSSAENAYLEVKSLLKLACTVPQADGKGEEEDGHNHLYGGLQQKTPEFSHETVDGIAILLSIGSMCRVFVVIPAADTQTAATVLSLRFDTPLVQDNTGDEECQLIDVNNQNRGESVEAQPEDCGDRRQASQTKGHRRRDRSHCYRKTNIIKGITNSFHRWLRTISTIVRAGQDEDVVKPNSKNDEGQEL